MSPERRHSALPEACVLAVPISVRVSRLEF